MKTVKQQVEKRLREFLREVSEAGELLRGLPLPVITEEVFGLYEETGDRLQYERIYFGRRKALAVFGLLSIWYRRQEDIRELCGIVQSICEETTWALPAHVDRQKEGWERTVDLFSCETGQALAVIVSQLKGYIPEGLAAAVKHEISVRLIDSYLEQPFGTIRWEKFRNNWVAVCAGCLGSIAINLFGDEKEKQEACIRRVVDTMPFYLDGMEEDGTCPEGMSYYTYGMTYFVGFARQLREFTEGQLDLMENPKVERIARFQQVCFFDGGCTVSFSDGDRRDRFRLGLTCNLAMSYPGIKMPPMESVMRFHDDTCYRFMALYQDRIWVEDFLAGCEEELDAEPEGDEWFTVLGHAQWAVGKSANGTGMAIKGGNNGESHNHNDIGSFLYVTGGEIFISDLGCGEYTKQYFGSGRYEILCNRSLGHSVPLINGREQQEGSNYRSENFAAGTTSVGGCEMGTVDLSMKQAYPDGIVKALNRRAVFERESGRLLLTDTFLPSHETKELVENLVTQIEPCLAGDDTVRLSGTGSSVCIRMIAGPGKWSVVKDLFVNHEGQEEAVWLLQWKLLTANLPVACTMEISICGTTR